MERRFEDYCPAGIQNSLTPDQQKIVYRFLGFLLEAREAADISVGRAMRIYRLELNGRYYKVKGRIK